MPVNSHLVRCPHGVAIVDAQLYANDARRVRDAVEQLDVPLLAVLLTHPQPDHYAGAAALTKGLDVPVVSTPEVAAEEAESYIVGPLPGPEWPREHRSPDLLVEDGETEPTQQRVLGPVSPLDSTERLLLLAKVSVGPVFEALYPIPAEP